MLTNYYKVRNLLNKGSKKRDKNAFLVREYYISGLNILSVLQFSE